MPSQSKKIAIVTGASCGIGEAVARCLSDHGFKVYGTSRKGNTGRSGDNFEMLPLDVTKEASIKLLVADVLKREGRIDLLVNNAGYGLSGGAEEATSEQIKKVFETNVFGLIRMIQEVLPHMRSLGSGRIINISSVFGEMPAPFMAIYSSTKHAVEGFSESLDHEIRPLNIRSILVQPAHTKSNFDLNTEVGGNTLSIYNKGRKAVSDYLKNDKTADPCDTVAKIILKAATVAQPKVRYAGSPTAAQVLNLRRFAPTSLFEIGFRKTMGLNR